MNSKRDSGQHPAVVGYRRRLESKSAEIELDALDVELQEFLRDVKSTPLPPKQPTIKRR